MPMHGVFEGGPHPAMHLIGSLGSPPGAERLLDRVRLPLHRLAIEPDGVLDNTFLGGSESYDETIQSLSDLFIDSSREDLIHT